MASGKFTWTVPATKFLISEYEANEMLYNCKHPDYKNRNKRVALQGQIAEAVSSIAEGCTTMDVRKKINGLRCQYLAEKMKITKSVSSGADADTIYKPTAYWYPMLKFLDTTTTADESRSNTDVQESESLIDEDEENIPEVNILNKGHDVLSPTPSTSCTHIPKKPKCGTVDSILLQASATMKEMSNIVTKNHNNAIESDECVTFGNFVVGELRGILRASNDCVFRQVKRKIQTVLMETWDTIDAQLMAPVYTVPSGPSSEASQWSTTTEQSDIQLAFHGNTGTVTHAASSLTADAIRTALYNANIIDDSH